MAKTVYKKKIKNGKEYYFFRLRHENLTKPKDIYGTTIKELEGKIKAARQELDNNIQNNKQYFEAFFADWLFDVHFLKLKPSSKEKYEGIYRNYIKNSSLSTIKVKEISLKDVQEYYNKLHSNGSSVSCIGNINKLIAPCIRYAYNNNLILKDFTKAIILPKKTEEEKMSKKDDVIPFTIDEQKRFIAAIKGHQLEMLFLFALNTGLRQGELLSLTWDDIDLNDYLVTVNKTVRMASDVTRDGRGKLKVQVQTPKTYKAYRTISFPMALKEPLELYKRNQEAHKKKLANLYQDNNLIFCTEYGKYLDSSNVRKRLNKIIDDINSKEDDPNKKIARRKFHDLRHTFATRLFELNEHPKTVQELLGHSNVSITLDTYTHVLDSLKTNAVSKLNDLFLAMDDN